MWVWGPPWSTRTDELHAPQARVLTIALLASRVVRRQWLHVGATLLCVGLLVPSCTTVERGDDFSIAEVVFDENFYYCEVEPMLFRNACGPGAMGDPAGGCHFNVTTFKLTNYAPLVGDSCNNGRPTQAVPAEAQNNYAVSQVKMRLNVDSAPLLTRPTNITKHPRQIFADNSADAQIIRDWSKLYTTQ